ncbi:hypothetical protein BDV27DRAFT_123201, partial [Aspergillus caelatus]
MDFLFSGGSYLYTSFWLSLWSILPLLSHLSLLFYFSIFNFLSTTIMILGICL